MMDMAMMDMAMMDMAMMDRAMAMAYAEDAWRRYAVYTGMDDADTWSTEEIWAYASAEISAMDDIGEYDGIDIAMEAWARDRYDGTPWE